MRVVIAINSPESEWRWPASATERLRQQFPGVEFAEYDSRHGVDAAARALFSGAEAVVAWQLAPELLRSAEILRWVHSPAAAVHQLLSPELVASPVMVTNGASVHAPVVAEHGLALMLALARGLPVAVRAQERKHWAARELMRLGMVAADIGVGAASAVPSITGTIAGSTALLVGMGHIGRELARRLNALGAVVLGVRRNPARSDPDVAEMHAPGALRQLLPRADFVVLAVPATAATRSLMGAGEFGVMRRSAYLINLGRGTAVDEAALVAALAAGQLAGAGLDVFVHEPLPASSPLWSCARVLITPHVAAITPASWDRQVELFAAHLRKFLTDETVNPLVDKRRGY